MKKLGFGLLRLPTKRGGPGGYDWELIEQMVDLYLERGGRYFDTCYTYLDGYSETAVKRCLAERKPREAFVLCDKLPGYLCRSQEDCRRYFKEELARCGVTYFDVYMLHWLNADHVRIAEQTGQFSFLEELKRKGLVRKTGFSYHDSADLLDRVLTDHPEIDVVQLQINYLDWESAGIESRRCYETAVRHGKGVYVMEPVKGGQLASLPPEAEALLRAAERRGSDVGDGCLTNRLVGRTPADWALSFVQSLPGVEICLSGMSSLAQVEENMREVDPLTSEEVKMLGRVAEIIGAQTRVPCTGCGYCLPYCPKGIAIPEYFRLYNELSRNPDDGWKIRPVYRQKTQAGAGPADCLRCGRCTEHCPQRIAIPDYLKEVAQAFRPV